jgi:hypothetical protein
MITKTNKARIKALEQQVQDRLDRMEPILTEISECQHLISRLRALDHEEEFLERQSTVGHIVSMLTGLRTPRVDAAFRIMMVLFNLRHDAECDAEVEPPADDAPPVLH